MALFALLAVVLQAFAPVGQVWAAAAQMQDDWVFPPGCVAFPAASGGNGGEDGGDPSSPAGRLPAVEHCGFCIAAGSGGVALMPPAQVIPLPELRPARSGPWAATPAVRQTAASPALPRGPPVAA